MHELFLDIETSGIDSSRHFILSIGMVVSLNGLIDYQSFYREIKYGELIVAPEAIEVNRFSFIDQTGRIPLLQADEEAVSFIKKYYSKDDKPMPVGLNVGSFDMQFIKKHMPLLASRLCHRTVELNSLLYMLAHKHSKNFKTIKEEFSQKATANTVSLGLGVEKHNAFFDAMFNLNLYLLIKKDLLNLSE